MQQALEDEVAPTLHQMMVHQAKVELRLELLEITSWAGSVDGELLAERTRLLNFSGTLDAMGEEVRVQAKVPKGRRCLSLSHMLQGPQLLCIHLG